MHLHIGHNIPGYLPEDEPHCADTASAAFALFHCEVTAALDEITDDATFLRIDTERNTITESDVACGVARTINGRTYWVETAAGPAHECELHPAYVGH